MNIYKNYSDEAEQCVLGSLLTTPDRFIDVAEHISEEDFWMYAHKVIFRAMVFLDSKRQPIDISTIIQTLSNNGCLDDAGGIGYLAQLAHEVATPKNVMAYVALVKEKTSERNVITVAQAMIKEIAEGEADSSERVNNALAMPMSIDTSEKTELTTNEILKQAVNDLEFRCNNKGKITGLRTNYKVLDERFHGLNGGQFVILAARPAMGKTSLALNLAANMAFDGNHGTTVFFSLEMTSQELMGKLICSTGKIDYKNYRAGTVTDEEFPKISYAVTKIKGTDLVIDDRAGLTLQQIRAKCIRQKRKTGKLKAVFVDYLTLIRTPNKGTRTEEVGALSRGLKGLSKELDCPVIALAQLNRAVEATNNKKPNLSHLRDSGEIEQDADIVMFIYRDEVYNPESQHKGIAEIITSKNRAGETGVDYLQAELCYSRFNNLDFVPQEIQTTNKGF